MPAEGLSSLRQGVLAPYRRLTTPVERNIVNNPTAYAEGNFWFTVSQRIYLENPLGALVLGVCFETTFTGGAARSRQCRSETLLPCTLGETGSYASLSFADEVNANNWATGVNTIGEAVWEMVCDLS